MHDSASSPVRCADEAYNHPLASNYAAAAALGAIPSLLGPTNLMAMPTLAPPPPTSLLPLAGSLAAAGLSPMACTPQPGLSVSGPRRMPLVRLTTGEAGGGLASMTATPTVASLGSTTSTGINNTGHDEGSRNSSCNSLGAGSSGSGLAIPLTLQTDANPFPGIGCEYNIFTSSLPGPGSLAYNPNSQHHPHHQQQQQQSQQQHMQPTHQQAPQQPSSAAVAMGLGQHVHLGMTPAGAAAAAVAAAAAAAAAASPASSSPLGQFFFDASGLQLAAGPPADYATSTAGLMPHA
ncbi:unnamed protein product, partial [Protopolystoma xenopodis]